MIAFNPNNLKMGVCPDRTTVVTIKCLVHASALSCVRRKSRLHFCGGPSSNHGRVGVDVTRTKARPRLIMIGERKTETETET